MKNFRSIPKLALAALFAAGTATAVVAGEAANPAQPGQVASVFSGESQPAAAQPWGYHPGWYAWHNRYWAHRRWHGPYWDGYRHYHPGFYIYF
jgi:hypothetical protein